MGFPDTALVVLFGLGAIIGPAMIARAFVLAVKNDSDWPLLCYSGSVASFVSMIFWIDRLI